MITTMTHVSIYVLNQTVLSTFYTNKLGFKVLKRYTNG